MPRARKYVSAIEAVAARRLALTKYHSPAEAKEARLQQMRQWRQNARDRRKAEHAIAVHRDDVSSIPPPKYQPTSTYCPGSIAFGILYGDRSRS